jgi:RecA-family ATPase
VSAGVGAVGKSSKSIVDALAMTTGRDLIGIKPVGELRVAIINLEDNRKEVNRRTAAVMKHYHLTKKDVGDRLFIIAKGELKLKIAEQTNMGKIKPNPAAIQGLIKFLVENQIDVLSIDPLRKTHRVAENDNTAMGEVIECYEYVAENANCAIHIWHHNRKSNSGETTVDSLRGAFAIVDAARSIEMLETMNEAQARKFGIEEARH